MHSIATLPPASTLAGCSGLVAAGGMIWTFILRNLDHYYWSRLDCSFPSTLLTRNDNVGISKYLPCRDVFLAATVLTVSFPLTLCVIYPNQLISPSAFFFARHYTEWRHTRQACTVSAFCLTGLLFGLLVESNSSFWIKDLYASRISDHGNRKQE